MTDARSEAFGRKLVEKTAFEREAVWLPMLAAHHLNAGQPVIDGKTFTDCVIEGPAVIAPVTETYFDDCNFGAAADPKNLLLAPVGGRVVGAIGFSNTTFTRCRFSQVGFTGDPRFLDEMQRIAVKPGRGSTP